MPARMNFCSAGPSSPASLSDFASSSTATSGISRDVVCSRQPYGYSIRSRSPSSSPAMPSGSVDTSSDADAGMIPAGTFTGMSTEPPVCPSATSSVSTRAG